MGTLLDTTIFVALERELAGDHLAGALAEVARRLHREVGGDEEVGIAVITASELLHGVHRAGNRQILARREAFVEAVIEAFPPIPFDLRCGRVHSRLWAQLAAAGTDIGPHDRIVAATALAHGWRVATANLRHFQGITGLSAFQPDLSA